MCTNVDIPIIFAIIIISHYSYLNSECTNDCRLRERNWLESKIEIVFNLISVKRCVATLVLSRLPKNKNNWSLVTYNFLRKTFCKCFFFFFLSLCFFLEWLFLLINMYTKQECKEKHKCLHIQAGKLHIKNKQTIHCLK